METFKAQLGQRKYDLTTARAIGNPAVLAVETDTYWIVAPLWDGQKWECYRFSVDSSGIKQLSSIPGEGKFIEAAGFSDTTQFFREITPEQDQQLSNPQPQEQQPDPAIQAMIQQSQAQVQIAQQKAMADVEANRQKAIADIQLARDKAAAEIQLAREKAAAQLELKKAEFEVEAQLKAAKVGAGLTSNMEIPG